MNLTRFLLGAVLAAPILAFAQPDTVWTRSISGARHRRVALLNIDNQYLIATDNGDFLLHNMTSEGELSWSCTYPGRPNNQDVADIFGGLAQLTGGLYTVAGHSGDAETIIWTDAEGREITRRYYYLYEDVFTLFDNCFATPDDEIFITGNEVLKLDPDGEVLWRDTYPIGDYPGYFNGVTSSRDGNYLLYGVPNPFGGPDFYAVKIDSDGDVVARWLFGTDEPTESCGAAIETRDGGWCLAGGQSGVGSYIVRADSEGNSIWERAYNNDMPLLSVVETSDGGFAAVGPNENSYLTQIRVDCNGDTLWTKRWGAWRVGRRSGWLLGELRAILLEEDGGYVMAGHITGIGPYATGVFIQRTAPDPVDLPQLIAAMDALLDFGDAPVDSNRELILRLTNPGRRWTQVDSITVSDPAFSFQYALPVKFFPWDTLDVAVAFHPPADTIYEATLSVWVEDEPHEVLLSGRGIPLFVPDYAEGTYPVRFALTSAHPNPLNSTTRISYNIPNKSKVSICLYDISGRIVATLVNSEQVAGSYSHILNADGLSAGIYFIRMDAGAFRAVRKVVLVK